MASEKKYIDPTRFLSAVFTRLVSDFIVSAVKINGLKVEEIAIITLVASESIRPLLDNIYTSKTFGFEFEALPDSERTPVSKKFIYESLGINRETLRRRLSKLVERGMLKQVSGGYIFPEQQGDNDYTFKMRSLVTRRFYEISSYLEKAGAIKGRNDD